MVSMVPDDYERLAAVLEQVAKTIIKPLHLSPPSLSYFWPRKISTESQTPTASPTSPSKGAHVQFFASDESFCGVRIVADNPGHVDTICKTFCQHLCDHLRFGSFRMEEDPLATGMDDADPQYVFASNSIRVNARLLQEMNSLGLSPGYPDSIKKEKILWLSAIWVDIQVCTPIANRWKQTQLYRTRRSAYAAMSRAILPKLSGLISGFEFVPQSIISSRPKSVEAFAEKIGRKGKNYLDPCTELTDLCGARVVTYSLEQLQRACELVEASFVVDWKNSDVPGPGMPKEDRRFLGAKEFWYRSVHYIVYVDMERLLQAMPSDMLSGEDVNTLRMLPNLRAEVQIRTILAHAWGELTHETSYKAPFPNGPPFAIDHQFSFISASLEQVDSAFQQVQKVMLDYTNTYGTTSTSSGHTKVFRSFQLFYKLSLQDPANSNVALTAAKLANVLEKYEATVHVLEQHASTLDPILLCELGIAQCRLHKSSLRCEAFLSGRGRLLRAHQLSPRNTYILLSLAEVYGHERDASESAPPDTALPHAYSNQGKYLQQAYEIDPADPAVLCEYLQWQIFPPTLQSSSCTSVSPFPIISFLRPAIIESIRRCDEQEKVGLNIPWVHYRKAFFHLLLGSEEDGENALIAYANAIGSKNQHVIQLCSRTLSKFEEHFRPKTGSATQRIASYQAVEALNLALKIVFGQNKNAVEALKKLYEKGRKQSVKKNIEHVRDWEYLWEDLLTSGLDPRTIVFPYPDEAGRTVPKKVAFHLARGFGAQKGEGVMKGSQIQ